MNNGRKNVLITIAVLAAIALIVGGVVLFGKKKPASNAATESASTTNSSSNTSPSNATYKDGTYKATGSYESPGGTQSITISVTLKDGVITDTSATEGANDPTAQQHQDEFVGGYKQMIVGKKIDSVRLSRVSGSSLTSQGFNIAIDQIKNQAKA
ncbi:MAG TPA: hypothetical protein VLF87_03570 [Patescibacteria group bacterium]|nr:hypothetical protein [Patescibacteria group bacterium]